MQQKPTYEELEQFAEIFAMSLDMICIADIRSARFLRINAAFTRSLGYPEAELLGRSFLEFVHPDDVEATVAILRDRLQQGENVLSFTNRYRCSDGRYIWLEWLSHPDAAKGITYAVARDITDRVETEQALLESRRRLLDIVDFLPDATLAIDADKRVILWNRAIERMTGIPASEMIGKGDYAYTIPFYGRPREQLMDLIWVDDERIAANYPAIRREGDTLVAEAFSNALYGGKGAWIWMKASPLYDAKGNIAGAIESIRDITTIRQAEAALQESERLFRIVFQHAPVGMAVIDTQRKFLQVNDSICTILGYSAEELVGRSFNDFTHPEDREGGRKRWAEMLKGEMIATQAEKRYIHRSGRVIWTIAQNALIAGSDGAPMFVVSHLIDITAWKQAEEERVKLEEQLRQAQKLESIGRLAGGVAHDFNNKLQAILGFTQMALEEAGRDSVLRRRLLAIQNAAEGSANLTRQLLAFARKQTVSPRVLDLNEIISGMISMLKRLIGENINLFWAPTEEIWPIRIDPGQIDQILVNLCVNGRDAIEGNAGTLTIETQNVSLDESYCRSHPGFFPGDYVMLAVSDTGCGMEPDLVDHIFEPFFTTKEQGKGTGLGLATVYGIVRQNAGMIHVYSEPGKGSTFRMYFPRTDGHCKVIPESAAAGHVGGQETILIVEDDAAILEVAEEVLCRFGYAVLTANSPDEALQKFRAHSGEIHLLITDVIMPEMNGQQLSVLLQEACPGLRTLFMSGYTANVIAHHGVLDEGVSFIQKPFSVTTLLEKVRMILDAAENGG
ncbi:PAS domain S-box protein [Desulfatirhabdium butyrativorans]|uniref:PAS domain S-box protein n=1 Tax=Desulfatirhabdium butyrativorans TaxID=340467 RepID=UPI0003FF999E|nr:PAS domain S-box protein [Desulfatirhabdium butyrativorans]